MMAAAAAARETLANICAPARIDANIYTSSCIFKGARSVCAVRRAEPAEARAFLCNYYLCATYHHSPAARVLSESAERRVDAYTGIHTYIRSALTGKKNTHAS